MKNFDFKNNKPLVIGGVVVLLVVILLIGLNLRGVGGMKSTEEKAVQMSINDIPVNVALDFATEWLKATESTSTNPYESGFATSTILSPSLRERLVASQATVEASGVDPVTCQSATTTELRINGRSMNEQPDRAQVLIMARRLPNQAVYTLLREGEGWYINDISCAAGEFEPDREFSFDREGNLLKNVPKPLDSQYWHLVFTEDGKPGHTAPLFFDENSTCLAFDGSEGVCDTAQFREAVGASVQGEMTETGVKVKKLKILE